MAQGARDIEPDGRSAAERGLQRCLAVERELVFSYISHSMRSMRGPESIIRPLAKPSPAGRGVASTETLHVVEEVEKNTYISGQIA